MKESVRPARSNYRAISQTYTLTKQSLSGSPSSSRSKTIRNAALSAAFCFLAAGIIVHSAIAQETAQTAMPSGVNRVALVNSTHPATRTAADLGRLAPD